MKFILLQDYAPTEVATEFISAWASEDAAAHIGQSLSFDQLPALGEPIVHPPRAASRSSSRSRCAS